MNSINSILVIEDDADSRANLVLMLEMEGFRVHAAADGDRGLEAARRERPALILCDIAMPGRDGYAVLEALRAEPGTAAIPLIFLTAKCDRSDQRRGMNLGADDYLHKPAGAEEVLAAVRARLQRRGVRGGAAPDFRSAAPLERLGLTPREAEVLLWLAQGKANAAIGRILGCAENTVKVHVARIFDKLGCDNRHAAMALALDALSG